MSFGSWTYISAQLPVIRQILITDHWPLATASSVRASARYGVNHLLAAISSRSNTYASPKLFVYGSFGLVLRHASIRAGRHRRRDKLGRDHRRILHGDRIRRLRTCPGQSCRLGNRITGPQSCRPSRNPVRPDSRPGAHRVAGTVHPGDYLPESEVRVSEFHSEAWNHKSLLAVEEALLWMILNSLTLKH